jgi:DNA-directed RNA polymerase specialized sigma24 family protein
LIRGAIECLPEDSQEILLDLAEGRVTRLEMIDRMGINRNTFDSRLRSLRLKLRQQLLDDGVL